MGVISITPRVIASHSFPNKPEQRLSVHTSVKPPFRTPPSSGSAELGGINRRNREKIMLLIVANTFAWYPNITSISSDQYNARKTKPKRKDIYPVITTNIPHLRSST
jgi:hypothetical protein